MQKTEIDQIDWRKLRASFEEKFIPEPNSGCSIWLGALDKGGYGTIATGTATPAGNKRSIQAHRASFLLEFGPDSLSDGSFVCHRCDFRPCVNPDHLFKGDHTANMQDAAKKGRLWSILTADQVRSILLEDAEIDALASRYTISRRMIRNIRNGKSWRHISNMMQAA
jgi:hypothetical protein